MGADKQRGVRISNDGVRLSGQLNQSTPNADIARNATLNRIAISDLTDGASIDQPFRVGDKQLRVNRDGGKYILLKLSDRSGTIVAMMWNADQQVYDSFERADYVVCRGRTQIHKGSLQIIATRIEQVPESEVDVADFDRFDAAASDQRLERLRQLFDEMENPDLRRLADAYFSDAEFLAGLRTAAAAVSNHHAYPGGLLRHTIDMMEMCRWFADRYDHLDADLLMFGAFLHDLGKIDELAGDGEIAYTDRGQLLGHIVIGIQMLDQRVLELDAPPFPSALKLQLQHLIASHHGLLEYGSPKIPLTLEAVALHHIDNLDAKISSYTSVIETDVSADPNWTNYNPSIGRKLWKPQS